MLAGPAATLASAAAAKNGKTPDSSVQPASIEFWNRHITTLRSNLAGADPEDRADRAMQRLKALPIHTQASDIELQRITFQDQEAVALTYKGIVLFTISAGDLDSEAGETLPQASQAAVAGLQEALKARENERHWPVIRRGLLFTVLSLAVLIGVLWLVWKAFHAVYDYVHGKEQIFPYRPQLYGIDLLPHISGAVYTVLRVVAWLLTLGGIYAWLTNALGFFPYTEPWGRQLGGFVFNFLETLGIAAVRSLPGIFSCIVILLIARWVSRLGKAFFRQVADGSIRISWMDPDVAHATQRIFAVIVWVFAVVVAYPYIPGSSSEAFKGISVFFGLVISLGSTGIINQVMSGLFVVYSKALRNGEWVTIGDKTGEVLEVGLLAVKLRTVEMQEVTVPNSLVVSTTTTNHARLGYESGMPVTCTVTIGYDAPWRQVHALLLLGAERTSGLRTDPAPYVLQRSLSDFYVEYTLIARLAGNTYSPETHSQLYANMQDAFNEYGVQIMSPHFMMQPHQNVVVDKSQWYAAPAAKGAAEASEKRFEAGC